MQSGPPTEPIARLLAERAWLRRLASALVRDEAAADDLTQEAYVAALERPPPALRAPRAWLATVLRNRLRNRLRDENLRRTRESEGPVATEVEPPDRAFARAELVERVARLVLALPEPYRSTIVLRYFEDLPPRLVAERQGIPVETVRTRTRRALAMLRGQLDNMNAGRRDRWVSALLPWAVLGETAAVGAAGTTALASLMKIGIVLLAAFLLTAGLWTLRGRLDRDRPREEPPAGTSTTTADGRPRLVGQAGASQPSIPGREGNDIAVRVRGRVVDDRRYPVEGATVRIGDARTTADADGRFDTTWVPEGVGVAVSAQAADGRVAYATYRVPAAAKELDAGVLVLAEGEGLEVQVRRREGEAVQARLVVWPLVPLGMAPILELETDGEGRVTLAGLPRGGHRILALAAGYGRAEIRVWIPRFVEEPCVIDLDPPRDVRLRVLDSQTDEPVTGATISLFDSPDGVTTVPRTPSIAVEPTNADGETVLQGIGRQESPLVLFQGGGIARLRQQDGRWYYPLMEVRAEVTEQTWKVYRAQPARWRIVAGEVDAPGEGSHLRVLANHGMTPFAPPVTRIEGEYVVTDATAAGRCAVTDDGRIALLEYAEGKADIPTTAFRRTRRITVVAREEDGKPAPGVSFRADGGNENPLVPVAVTDEQGEAVLEGFYGGTVALRRVAPSGRTHYDLLSTLEIDLEKGDARVDLTLPPRVEVTLRVRVEGEPKLPARYELTVNRVPIEEVEENPADGTLRFTWRRPYRGPQVVHVEADSALRGVATIPADESEVELDIDLQLAGTLFARILNPPGRHPDTQVTLQADSEAGWQDLRHIPAVGFRTPPDGHHRFGPIAPGRYRVVDLVSGLESAAVEISTHGPPPTTLLDLRDLVTVKGRVEVPEGRSFEDVRVIVIPSSRDVEAAPQPGLGRPVRDDGTFTARVSAGRGATLLVKHPVLRPDPERGRVVVTGDVNDVVLALVATTEAVLRLDPPVDFESRSRTTPQARLYRGSLWGEPAAQPSVTIEKEVVRIAGYTPGTWTLWLDLGVDLPIVRHDVELGAGLTDLGTASLRRGSTLKVRVRVAEGRATPFLGLFVKRVEAPVYTRYLLFQQREPVLDLPGLLPGTWEIQVLLPEPERFPKQVTVGEDETVDLVLDLR